jgi:hypothetical protein
MHSSCSPSPISINLSDSHHPALVLCDVHGEPLDLADIYRCQRQLAIRSAPPCSRFVNPMSSITSYNASNESPNEAPVQLPPHLSSPSPMPLLPRTICTTLQTQANIDNGMLHSIANGLLQTIAQLRGEHEHGHQAIRRPCPPPGAARTPLRANLQQATHGL